jgi:methionyl-tRNA synthetase
MSKPFYITTPIYYVNDKPHIGSAYTTIAADVLARFYTAQGKNVFFLTGTAEHGSKIAESAEKAEKSPQQFVDENASLFKSTWEQLNIVPSDFIRTTEERHLKAVNLFFTTLKESGKLYEGEYEGWYCIGCESFKKESELVNDVCPLHNRKPEWVKEKNWFFKLSEYGTILADKIRNDEIKVLPQVRKNEILSFIDQGLEDIAVSRRTAQFAMQLPWDSEQTIYVWLDELFNYCSAVGYESDRAKFDRYWPADVHLVGKDIIKFHCIIWPALLLAIGEQPPKSVFAHGFFTVNGQKMSKSLGNVIDPVELAAKYGSDAVRYFLLREVPFGQDGDVSEEKIRARYEGDLANGFGNLVSRVTTLIEKYLDGIIPENTPGTFHGNEEEVQSLIAHYRFHDALVKIWEWVAEANKKVDESKLWELGKSDLESFARISKELVLSMDAIARNLQPFMPDISKQVLDALAASTITKVPPLFPRIP